MSRISSERGSGAERISRKSTRKSRLLLKVGGLAAISVAVAAESRANITIIPTYAANINADVNATAIKNGIQAAINDYQFRLTDNITVNITFQEGGGLGASSTFITQVPYTTYRTQLTLDASTTDDATALAHLPVQTNSPVDNQANMWLTLPNARALGINATNSSDATITLNTSIMNLTRPPGDLAKYDLKAVAQHEIDEVLGTGSGLNLPVAFPRLSRPQDLFRYDGAGNRSYVATTSDSEATSYFSIDGTTLLARFNQNSGGDYGDFFSTGVHTPQVQDAFGTPGSTPDLGVELRNLDVIGYNVIIPEPTTASLTLIGLSGACLRRTRTRKS